MTDRIAHYTVHSIAHRIAHRFAHRIARRIVHRIVHRIARILIASWQVEGLEATSAESITQLETVDTSRSSDDVLSDEQLAGACGLTDWLSDQLADARHMRLQPHLVPYLEQDRV